MKLLNLYNGYPKANTNVTVDLPRPKMVIVVRNRVIIDEHEYIINIDPDLFLDCLSEIMTGFEVSSTKDWNDVNPPLYKVIEYDIPEHVKAEIRGVQSKKKSSEDC